MAKKKSTADILAQLRAQDSGKKKETPADGVVPEDIEPESGTPEVEETTATKPVSAKESGEPPAAKPQATPTSTTDILARLRAEAAGGGKPSVSTEKSTAAEKPAAEKAAPAKEAAVAVPEGEKPSLQEMLKAVRSTEASQEPSAEQVAEAEAKPVRGKPAALRKPAARAKAKPDRGRRNVLMAALVAPLALVSSPFAAAWTFFSAATAAFSLAVARFMMPNVLVEPPSQFKVGSPSDYPAGTVTTKWKSEFGVWIVHTESKGQNLIYALFSICTHLGCTPNWLEAEQKFKCPCHGSGFYISGVNFEGPAPRPLERTAIRVAADGMLEVDKSRKFQRELGQWDDPASFVELA
jgi:cytochrome b6-f complex iron-sulfur subunit